MNKLLAFQKRVGAIKKDSVNPYYKSKYVDINSLLDVVKPLLNECRAFMRATVRCGRR